MRLPFAAASRFFASSSAALAVGVHTPVSTYTWGESEGYGRTFGLGLALRLSSLALCADLGETSEVRLGLLGLALLMELSNTIDMVLS